MVEQQKQTVGQRLTQLVEETGWSRAAFARQVGIGDTTLKSYMSDATEPGVSDLIRICEVGEARLEWLVYGREPQKAGAIAERVSAHDAEDWLHRTAVQAVVVALEEELRAEAINPTPEKRADLVVALCLIFRRPDSINRDAIRALIRLAK